MMAEARRRYPKKKAAVPKAPTRRNRLFRFPLDLDDAIYHVADAKGISMNELVSEWMREHPDIQEALTQRARRAQESP